MKEDIKETLILFIPLLIVIVIVALFFWYATAYERKFMEEHNGLRENEWECKQFCLPEDYYFHISMSLFSADDVICQCKEARLR